jgi:hypothetical protein
MGAVDYRVVVGELIQRQEEVRRIMTFVEHRGVSCGRLGSRPSCRASWQLAVDINGGTNNRVRYGASSSS